MKPTLIRTILLSSLLFSLLHISWKSEPPQLQSGAPGELSCNSCHAPTNIAGVNKLEILGMPDTIFSNQTYEITVRLSTTNNLLTLAGFQMTLTKENTLKSGLFFEPSEGSRLTSNVGRNYFEHYPARILENGIAEWKVKWQSPSDDSTATQTFHIYASALICNGNNNENGDFATQVHKTSVYKSHYQPISTTFNVTPNICSGDHGGSIQVLPQGGKPPYQIIWSNGETGPQINNLVSGTYAATITDQGAGRFIGIGTVTQPFPLFGEIIKADIPCNSGVGTEATINASNGTPPYSYEWSTGSTSISTSVKNAGPISVTITDNNGCTYIANDLILNKGTFTANISQIQNVQCNGDSTGSATVIASSGTPVQFLWSNGATGSQAKNLKVGHYGVTISNADGCEAKTFVEIKEPSLLNINLNSLIFPSCPKRQNGIISVFADGGVPPYSYLWENNSIDRTRTFLGQGQYEIQVTDAFNCQILDTISLIDPTFIEIQLDHLDESAQNANDGKTSIQIAGGNPPYLFNWSNGINIQNQNNLSPGYYEVTVTDSKGCSKDTSLYISPYDCDLTIRLESKMNILCHGDESGNINLLINGGSGVYSIIWNNGLTGANIENLKAGNYIAKIEDSNGCISHAEIQLNQPPPFIKFFEITSSSAKDAQDGKLKINLAGGVPPYKVTFDTLAEITNFTGIIQFNEVSTGYYPIIIKDANGCSFSEYVVINYLGCSMTSGNAVIQNVACFGQQNGAICANIQNSNGDINLHWDDESSDNCIFNLSAGSYSLYAIDSAGCQVIDTFFVLQPLPLLYELVKIDTPINNFANGRISIQVNGGSNPYNFNWYKNGNAIDEHTSIINNLDSGLYHCIITDFSNCTLSTDTFELKRKILINNQQTKVNFLNIFPNPTSNSIFIPNNVNLGKHTVDIRNIAGKLVLTNSSFQNNVFQLPILEDGIYIIEVKTSSQIFVSKLVFINNE